MSAVKGSELRMSAKDVAAKKRPTQVLDETVFYRRTVSLASMVDTAPPGPSD